MVDNPGVTTKNTPRIVWARETVHTLVDFGGPCTLGVRLSRLEIGYLLMIFTSSDIFLRLTPPGVMDVGVRPVGSLLSVN